MPERFCDCTRCPCNVPVTIPGRDCADCKAGRHMLEDGSGRTLAHPFSEPPPRAAWPLIPGAGVWEAALRSNAEPFYISTEPQ